MNKLVRSGIKEEEIFLTFWMKAEKRSTEGCALFGRAKGGESGERGRLGFGRGR